MDIFGQVAAKRREIEEATKMNIAKSFQENLSTTTEVEKEKLKKSFDDELNDVHKELFGDDIEKARSGIYADNPLNRKLMRVGRKYGTNSKFKPNDVVRAKLPNGKFIQGKYDEPYSENKHTIKTDDGKLYGVDEKDIELIKRKWGSRKPTMHQVWDLTDKVDEVYDELRSLRRERKELEMEMEDALGSIGEEAYNGNNEMVVKYAKDLDKLDNNISKLSSKHKKMSDRLDKMRKKYYG